jgi:hypothetical protein
MSQTLECIVAKSLKIVLDYLEATGELGNPEGRQNTSWIPWNAHDPAGRKATAFPLE